MPGMPWVIAPSDRSIDHPDSMGALCCVACVAASANTALLPSMHRRFCFVMRTRRSACGWQGDFWFPGLAASIAAPIRRLAGVWECPQPSVWWWSVKWVLCLSCDRLWGYLVWLQKIMYSSFTTCIITHCLIIFLLLFRKYVIFQGVCWSGVVSRIRSFVSPLSFFMNQWVIGAKAGVTLWLFDEMGRTFPGKRSSGSLPASWSQCFPDACNMISQSMFKVHFL